MSRPSDAIPRVGEAPGADMAHLRLIDKAERPGQTAGAPVRGGASGWSASASRDDLVTAIGLAVPTAPMRWGPSDVHRQPARRAVRGSWAPEIVARVAAAIGADPDWLINRAAEIAAEAQLKRGAR